MDGIIRYKKMSFDIKNVANSISQHLKQKLLDIEHKIFVDLNCLVVPIVITDTHLANIAKRTFHQLPLPIRNLVLATGEIENEKVSAQIKVLEEDTRNLIKYLENIVHTSGLCRDTLKESKLNLENSALKAWKMENEDYRREIEDIHSAINQNFSLGEIQSTSDDLYNYCKIMELKISELRCVPEPLQMSPNTVEMNTTNISARIETSKQYRDHAKKLSSADFKFQDLLNETSHEIQEFQEPQEKVVECSTSVKDSKSKEILDELHNQVKKIRNKISEAWLPHRKVIQNELNNQCETLDKPILQSINNLENFMSAKIVNQVSFDKTVESLQNEFQYAIHTFPCDPSALKTCLLVMSEGPKLLLCRKLKEIKQEVARCVAMYMQQINTIFLEYHELSRPDSRI